MIAFIIHCAANSGQASPQNIAEAEKEYAALKKLANTVKESIKENGIGNHSFNVVATMAELKAIQKE